jgi:hypothetical protein
MGHPRRWTVRERLTLSGIKREEGRGKKVLLLKETHVYLSMERKREGEREGKWLKTVSSAK